MLFNSFEFLIFFLVVTLSYFLLPHKFRWFLLLVASCIFYMAFIPVYIFILAGTIFIDYYAGIFIEKSNGNRKTSLLLVSVLSTCLILFVFKYYGFVSSNVRYIADIFHWNYSIRSLNLLLPIGLESQDSISEQQTLIDLWRS